MICGAGTAVPCGRSACDHTPTALGGGEPMGALASSGGEEPFANWSYVENWLAYNWSVPVSGGGGCEVLRRRERPFLLFDDDGRVRPILSSKSLRAFASLLGSRELNNLKTKAIIKVTTSFRSMA